MVEVTICGCGQLEGAEADVTQGLVVNGIGFSSVLHQLTHRKGNIIGLHHGVRDLGKGTTLKVFIMRTAYVSWILLMNRVPMPEPVPPPSEWVSWKPWRQSQLSDSFLTTSRTESTSSAPSV